MKQLYKYARGEYSCFVSITEDHIFTFHNIQFPAEATEALKERFLEEAEEAALTYLDKQEKKYGKA